MSSLSAFSAATNGIRSNLGLFNDAASRIARQPQPSDLAASFVALRTAQHGVAANAAAIRAADEVYGTLLNIFA